MRAHLFLLAATVMGGVLAGPLRAGEAEDLRAEITQLRRQTEALEDQREALFRHEVESYLRHTDSLAAQGDDEVRGVSLDAYLVATALGTLDAEPGNKFVVQGEVGLGFEFEVTDNLTLFADVVANNPGAGFPAQFGAIAGTAGATLSGLTDGIGVDGTVSTAPGSVACYEAGIEWVVPIGRKSLNIRAGKLDPRNYYAGNAFAGNNLTQFLNNLFNDPPAINWRSNAAGAIIYGLDLSMRFGHDDEYRFNCGWFNYPGQWFNEGLFLWQFTWTTHLKERETNLRIYGQLDTIPDNVSAAVGVSWDWRVTDNIGVFVRATVKDNQPAGDGETNQVESDWQLGAVWIGPLPSRPRDQAGIAIGHIKGPVRAIIPGGAPGNSETPIELYYTFMVEESKMQISTVFQCILDPGAQTFTNPDQIFILGLRLYVSF